VSWSSVIGQKRVKDILKTSLERDRLAHAYLFIGQEGCGKFAVALELARILNCEKKSSESCGVCSSCQKFETLQHPNLKLIFPLPVGRGEKSNDPPLAKFTENEVAEIQEQIALKAKNPYHKIVIERANVIKINSIREIRRQAAMSLFGSGKKVFIILDAEKMNDESSNALLKTLEEPHPDTLLILLTTAVHSLLPTIISRCQLIRFDPLSDDVIAEALQKNRNIDYEKAKIIARLANGNYNKALLYIDTDYEDRMNKAIALLRAMLLKSRISIMNEIETLMTDYQKPEIEDVLHLMQQWLQEAMLHKEGVSNDIKSSSSEIIKRFLTNYPDWDFHRSFDAIDRAVSLLSKNVYIPLILLDLTFNIKQCATQS
jgi:DNA polymerase-3 subunit delta'